MSAQNLADWESAKAQALNQGVTVQACGGDGDYLEFSIDNEPVITICGVSKIGYHPEYYIGILSGLAWSAAHRKWKKSKDGSEFRIKVDRNGTKQ